MKVAAPIRALVLGANGQDGSYLAEALMARGAAVWGVARQSSSRWVRAAMYSHVALDIRDEAMLAALLKQIEPTEIYHFAAVHGSAGFSYEPVWRAALDVNIGSLHTCLEHARRAASGCRIFYASSLKAFGKDPPKIVGPKTPRASECLYSITKNAAADLVANYREAHGVRAQIGYYFNHDSPRRPSQYFLPRLVAQLALAIRGGEPAEPISTLSFACDWGSSAEFMELTIDFLRSDVSGDCVFATGVSWPALELVRELSRRAEIDPAQWLRARDVSDASIEPRCAPDLSALRGAVGRTPSSDAVDVALWILRENHQIELPALGGASQ